MQDSGGRKHRSLSHLYVAWCMPRCVLCAACKEARLTASKGAFDKYLTAYFVREA